MPINLNVHQQLLSIFRYLINVSLLANFRTTIPLSYFNILAETINAKEEQTCDYSATFNSDVTNPNSHNRGNAFPILIHSSMNKDDRVCVLISYVF